MFKLFSGYAIEDLIDGHFERVQIWIPVTPQFGFQQREQKKIARGQIWAVRWVASSLHFHLVPEDCGLI